MNANCIVSCNPLPDFMLDLGCSFAGCVKFHEHPAGRNRHDEIRKMPSLPQAMGRSGAVHKILLLAEAVFPERIIGISRDMLWPAPVVQLPRFDQQPPEDFPVFLHATSLYQLLRRLEKEYQ